MAYDEGLAERVREILEERHDVEEKQMFGGLSFMLRGNLCCGVIQEDLIVRVGPDEDAPALEKPFARAFDFTGRKMKGWVVVSPQGVEADEDLQAWVAQGIQFTLTLPEK